MLSEYVSDWPPLSVGISSPAGAEAAHNAPAAEAEMVSPLKLLDSMVVCTTESTCCCLSKAAFGKRKTTQSQEMVNKIKIRAVKHEYFDLMMHS